VIKWRDIRCSTDVPTMKQLELAVFLLFTTHFVPYVGKYALVTVFFIFSL